MTKMIKRSLRCLYLMAVVLLSAACVSQQVNPVASRLGERGPSYTVPQLALTPDGGVNLLWLATGPGKGWDVLFARSDDRGATWSKPTSLKPDVNTLVGWFKTVVSPSGAIYVIWQQRDQATTARSLRFLRSTDKGLHWDDLFRGLRPADEVGLPHLVVDEDGGLPAVWLTWEKFHSDVEVVNVPDTGAAQLPTPVRLTAFAPPGYRVTRHHFTSDGQGGLYAAWEEIKGATDFRIYLNRSVDRGKTWAEAPVLVSAAEDRPHMAHAPKLLALPRGQVYVVWEQVEFRPSRSPRPGEVMTPDRLIYVNRSLDSGRTWLPRPVRVSEVGDELALASNVQMSADRHGHLYVTWIEAGAQRERLFVARSTDSGVTWSKPVRLDLTSPFTDHLSLPEIRSDDAGHVWVLWQELTAQKTWQLLMNRSIDYGQTWQGQAAVLSERRHGGEGFAGIAFQHDGTGRLYVAWDGGAANDREISITRSDDFAAAWPLQAILVGRRQ